MVPSASVDLDAGDDAVGHDQPGAARRRSRASTPCSRQPASRLPTSARPSPSTSSASRSASTSGAITPVPPPVGVSATFIRPRRTDHALGPAGDRGVGEQRRLDRAAALRLPAGVLGVVVGEAVHELEVHRGRGLQPVDQLGERCRRTPRRARAGSSRARATRGSRAPPAGSRRRRPRGRTGCRAATPPRWTARSCRRPVGPFSSTATRAPACAAASAAVSPAAPVPRTTTSYDSCVLIPARASVALGRRLGVRREQPRPRGEGGGDLGPAVVGALVRVADQLARGRRRSRPSG